MTLAVTILGSSGIYGTPTRAASGYLVEVDGSRLCLDAGAGAWRNLLTLADYPSIAGIVLTHRHPDHTTDVFQALHARHYGQAEPLSPIPLWAPDETIEVLQGYAPEISKSFDLRAIAEGESIEFNGASLSFVRMAHPPVTLGVRVEHREKVFAYSADSGLDADFETLARGADLFVCEATFQDADDPWPGHLSASQAGGLAAKADVARLVTTHLPPGRDHDRTLAEAQEAAGSIAVELAEDLRRFEL